MNNAMIPTHITTMDVHIIAKLNLDGTALLLALLFVGMGWFEVLKAAMMTAIKMGMAALLHAKLSLAGLVVDSLQLVKGFVGMDKL